MFDMSLHMYTVLSYQIRNRTRAVVAYPPEASRSERHQTCGSNLSRESIWEFGYRPKPKQFSKIPCRMYLGTCTDTIYVVFCTKNDNKKGTVQTMNHFECSYQLSMVWIRCDSAIFFGSNGWVLSAWLMDNGRIK